MNRVRQLIREVHRRSLWQVLGIYLVASWAVLQVVDTLGGALNLPDWFPSFALALLIVGLPVVLATAFIQEGGPGHDASPATEPRSPRPSRASGLFNWRNAFGGGVLAFALWGVVAAAWVLFGGGATTQRVDVAGEESVTQRLFVMPLDNLTDDAELDVLGRLAADEMARTIDRRGSVAVVPSATVVAAIRSLGDAPSVEAVAEGVQATHAVAGTVARIGDELRFDVELIDPRTSERLRSVDPVTGPADAVDSLVAEIAGRAAAEAAVLFNPSALPWVGDMSSPVSATAYEAFLEQGRIFCTGDNAGSIPLGERAVRESPRFVAALYQLMQAHSNLGNTVERDSLTEILEALRGEMTRNEQLSLDWMEAMRADDRDPVAMERASEEAYRLDPVGRSGAAMMSKHRLGKYTEAIERLHDLPLPGVCPWPGYYREGADSYHALGRYAEELELIQGGLEAHPDLRQFRDFEARALVGLGRLDAVDSLLEVIADVPGSDNRVFRPVNTAIELRGHGYEERAARIMESILEAQPTPRSARDLGNRAYVLSELRRWDEAVSLFESAAEDGELAANVGFLGDFGVALGRAGGHDEALDVAARIDGTDAPDFAKLGEKARVLAAAGDRDEAVRLLTQAFESGWYHNSSMLHDLAFEEMWGYGPFDALMRPR